MKPPNSETPLPRFELSLPWVLALTVCVAQANAFPSAPWSRFRGPNGSRVATDAQPPVVFGPSTNLLWKAPVGPGASSPVVGDRIYLRTGQHRWAFASKWK